MSVCFISEFKWRLIKFVLVGRSELKTDKLLLFCSNSTPQAKVKFSYMNQMCILKSRQQKGCLTLETIIV